MTKAHNIPLSIQFRNTILTENGYYESHVTYGIAIVYGFDSLEGLINPTDSQSEMKFAQAKPSPFPGESIQVHLYKHSSGKSWAISDCGNHGFSKSDRSFHSWMHFSYLANKSLNERVNEKIADGYELVGQAIFNPDTHQLDAL